MRSSESLPCLSRHVFAGLAFTFTFVVWIPLLAQQSSPQTASDTPDQHIRELLASELARAKAYKHVSFHVEDQIVTLGGTVELASQRRDLQQTVRRMPEVAEVENNIALDPPAVADEVLLPRLKQRIGTLNLTGIRFTAHDGLVSVGGSVRTRQSRNQLLQLVRGTPGVKEVESDLKVEEDHP
jgi:osmotically-inducible protein OsmY